VGWDGNAIREETKYQETEDQRWEKMRLG
jgi:hypothetical protein